MVSEPKARFRRTMMLIFYLFDDIFCHNIFMTAISAHNDSKRKILSLSLHK